MPVPVDSTFKRIGGVAVDDTFVPDTPEPPDVTQGQQVFLSGRGAVPGVQPSVITAPVEQAAQPDIVSDMLSGAAPVRRRDDIPMNTLGQLGVDPNANAIIRNTAAGLYSGGLAASAMPFVGTSTSADIMERELQKREYEQQAAALDAPGSAGYAGRMWRGTLASAVPVAGAGLVGGPAGAIAAGVGMEGGGAVLDAAQAGLTDQQAKDYTARALLFEAAPAAIMQRLGLGGLEKVFSTPSGRGAVIGGLRQAVNQMGVRTIEELPEEITTEVLHSVNAAVSGIDPNATTPEALGRTVRDTTTQTLMTMGLLSAPNLAASAVDSAAGRVQPPAAQPTDVEDVFMDGAETVEIAPPDAQTPTGPASPEVTNIPEPAAEPQEQPFVPDAQPPVTDWKAYYISLVTQGIDPEAAMMDVRAKREAELQRMFAEPTQADAVANDTEQAVRRAAETINQEAANETPAIQPIEDMAVPGTAAEPGPAAGAERAGVTGNGAAAPELAGAPESMGSSEVRSAEGDIPVKPTAKMASSYKDMRAAAIGSTTQARAAVGGEYGPNGEWYKGGAFIATTDMPKRAKMKIKRASSRLVQIEFGVGPDKSVPAKAGMIPIMNPRFGAGSLWGHNGVNTKYLAYLRDQGASEERIQTMLNMRDKYASGERWVSVNEYPNFATWEDAARMLDAGMPIPGALVDALPEDIKGVVQKYTPKAIPAAPAAKVTSTPASTPTAPEPQNAQQNQGGTGLESSTPASTPAEFDEKEYSEVDRKLSNGEYVPSNIVAKYPDLKELYNPEADPARDALSSLTRTELVATAKQFGVKANLTTPKMIDEIVAKQTVPVTAPQQEVTASDVPVTATQPARVTTMREARLAYRQAVDAAFQPGTDEYKFAMDAAPTVMKSFKNRDGSWDVGELQRVAVLKRGGVTNRATRIEDDDISMAVGPTSSVSAPTRDTRVVENAIRRLNVKSSVPSDVVMVKTLNDMPETVRAKYADQTAKGGSVRAMYDRGTGKTYFILSEIASGAKAEGVSPDVMAAGIYFHEMAAHHGLNVLPQPVRDTMIARVIADVPMAEMKSMLDPAYHDLSVTDMAEEYIAAVVEMARTEEGRRQLGTDRMAWWDRLWNWVVRNVLRRSEFKKLANVPKSVRAIADQLIQGLQDGTVRGGPQGVGRAAAMKSVDWAKLDADHLAAVERGDMDAAQRMVDEAAERAGHDTPTLFRGDRRGKTVFTGREDPTVYIQGNVFFSDSPDVAAGYASGNRRWKLGYVRGKDLSSSDGLYRAKLKMRRPIKIDAAGESWMDVPIPKELKKAFKGLADAQIDDIAKAANDAGYDGLIVQNVGDQYGESTQYVVFSPSQIKSADPVTRDDAGNIIPLSQRFNAESPDIRFSQSSKGTPTPTPLERFDVPAAHDSKTWAASTLLDYAKRNGLDRKTLTMRVMRRPNGDRYGLLYRKGEGGQPGAPFPTTPRNAKERLDALREMMVNAEEKQAELARQRKRSKERWTPRNIWKSIEAALANDTTYLPEQGQEAVREIRYSDGATLQYARDIKAMVYKPLVDAGVSETEFGAYLVARRAATERAAIQNPGDDMYTDVAAGMSGVNAREVLAQMERENGPERWAAITKAGDTFTELRKKHVIPKLKTSGLFTQAWLDKVENNDNYSTFEVLEYMDATLGGETKTARVYAQAGTAKDINNPFYATITNDRILLHAAAMNKGKLATVAVLAVDGQIEPAVMVGEAVRRPDDPRKGIIRLREDGKVKAYYVDGHIARVFDSPKDSLGASLFFRFLQLVTVPQKMLYTTLYPIFGVWNAQRDVRATVRALPKTGFGRMFMEMALTAPPAFKDAFRKESDPLMREMLEANLLITGRTWSALEADDEVTHFERMNKFFDLDRREQFIARAAKAATTDFNQFFERWTKLAAFRRMKALGYAADSPQMKKMIRELAGSPDFLARGTLTRWLNSVFIFSNPAVQGLRQVVRGAKNNPLGFAMKVTMYTAVPAIIQAVMEAGLFAHDDDDDKVPEAVREMRNILDADGWMSWLRDRYARVPERDKMLFNTVPIADDNDSTGYVPLPIDHAGQIVHAFTRKAVLSLLGIKSASTAKLTASSVPWNQGNLNQFLDLIMDAGLIWSGVNPQDEYTGQPTIDPTIFEAGGKDVGIEFAKQKFNDILGSIAFKFDRPYDVREKTSAEKAGATPFLGPAMRRFYRVEQRGLADTERLKQQDVDREKAGMRKGAKEFIQEFIPGNEKKPAPYVYRQAVKSGAIPKDYPKASFNALWRNALKNRNR